MAFDRMILPSRLWPGKRRKGGTLARGRALAGRVLITDYDDLG